MTQLKEKESEDSPGGPRFRIAYYRWWIGGAAVFLLVAVGAFILISRGAQKAPHDPRQASSSMPGVPVVAAPVKKGEFSMYLSGLGTVTPINTVTVKTRVDGELTKVLFKEGQLVSKGELLAEIDPRPFEVQLTQAEGALVRDKAQLENARLDQERYRDLVKRDLIPKQQLDTQDSLVHQLEGAIKTDQGQIDNARLQLTYARVTAPISGRIGLRQVDPGNIVHASDTGGLAVITQMQPITIVFSLPEDSLSQVLGKLRSGARLSVEAYDRDQKQRLAEGTLLTVDNQIDPTTGTVKLKAEFPNRNNELFPNQFVNARLIIDVKQDALIVPSPAIQRGPQGTFVYVVRPDQTAEMRPVTLGASQEGVALIASGLTAGEQVVVDGADRLRNGGKVEVKSSGGGTPASEQRQHK